jgi:hypothetical protein
MRGGRIGAGLVSGFLFRDGLTRHDMTGDFLAEISRSVLGRIAWSTGFHALYVVINCLMWSNVAW